MSETPLEYIQDIKNQDDIAAAINKSPKINEIVNQSLSIYSIINVSDAMTQLGTVGDLLKVSNAASRGHSSSVAIIEILSNYQSMINECDVTTDFFVQQCITCLGYYKYAITFVEKNNSANALKMIGKTSEKAQMMATKCDELIKKAQDLVALALKALGDATGDQIGEVKKFKDNEKKKTDLENDAAGLRSEIESLNEQITELKELADKAEEEEREDRIFDNIMSALGLATKSKSNISSSTTDDSSTTATNKKVENMIKKEEGTEDLTDNPNDDATTKVIKKQKRLKKQKKEKKDELEKKETEEKELETKEKNGSITNEEKTKKENLKSEINTLKEAIKQLETEISNVSSEVAQKEKDAAQQSKDKSKEYNKLKYQYQDLKRNTNAELAANLQSIQNLVDQNIDIDVGIKCLQIVITSMGKVKTIFENTRIFWNSVKTHCESLTDISRLKVLGKIIKPEKPHLVIKFENEIKRSGLSWLALAYVNSQALNSIIKVKHGVDDIMNNLPNKQEAKSIVKQCTDAIQKKLDDENKEIDDVKNKLQHA